MSCKAQLVDAVFNLNGCAKVEMWCASCNIRIKSVTFDIFRTTLAQQLEYSNSLFEAFRQHKQSVNPEPETDLTNLPVHLL